MGKEIPQTHRIIRKKIIKKIVVIDGKPVEIEEVVSEPLMSTDDLESQESQTAEITHTHKIIKKRIIRKILIVDGKPVEVEEFEEDPISDEPESQNLVTGEETTKMENKQDNNKIELTVEEKTIDTPTEVQVKTKDLSENIRCDKISTKQTLFNLPIPEHANDWMDVIEGGGFSLDDDDEEENNDDPTKGETGGMEKTGNISVEILDKQGLNTSQKEALSPNSSMVQSVLSEGSVSIIEQREILGEPNAVTIAVSGNEVGNKSKDNKDE